jgi:hypothetical protein
MVSETFSRHGHSARIALARGSFDNDAAVAASAAAGAGRMLFRIFHDGDAESESWRRIRYASRCASSSVARYLCSKDAKSRLRCSLGANCDEGLAARWLYTSGMLIYDQSENETTVCIAELDRSNGLCPLPRFRSGSDAYGQSFLWRARQCCRARAQ